MSGQPARWHRSTRSRAMSRGSVLALLVIALLSAGCSDSSENSSSSSSVTSTSAPATVAPTTVVVTTTVVPTTTIAPTTTTIAPTTTTILPLITEGAIVLIANAAGVPGAASQLSAELQAVGYAMKEPTDAAGYEESLDATKIYYLPVAEAAAGSLALVMQVNSVGRMPTPAPILDAQVGLGDATILLMLGKDLAGKTIPGLAER